MPREKGKERVQGSDTQQSKVSSDRLSVSKSLHKIHIIYAKGNPVWLKKHFFCFNLLFIHFPRSPLSQILKSMYAAEDIMIYKYVHVF